MRPACVRQFSVPWLRTHSCCGLVSFIASQRRSLISCGSTSVVAVPTNNPCGAGAARRMVPQPVSVETPPLDLGTTSQATRSIAVSCMQRSSATLSSRFPRSPIFAVTHSQRSVVFRCQPRSRSLQRRPRTHGVVYTLPSGAVHHFGRPVTTSPISRTHDAEARRVFRRDSRRQPALNSRLGSLAVELSRGGKRKR